jgi:hypothetical protein
MTKWKDSTMNARLNPYDDATAMKFVKTSTPRALSSTIRRCRPDVEGRSAPVCDFWDSRPELETALGLQDSTSRRGSEMRPHQQGVGAAH